MFDELLGREENIFYVIFRPRGFRVPLLRALWEVGLIYRRPRGRMEVVWNNSHHVHFQHNSSCFLFSSTALVGVLPREVVSSSSSRRRLTSFGRPFFRGTFAADTFIMVRGIFAADTFIAAILLFRGIFAADRSGPQEPNRPPPVSSGGSGGGPEDEIFASFLDIDHTGGGAVVPDPIAPVGTDEIFGFRGAEQAENKPTGSTNDPTPGGGVGGEEGENIFASSHPPPVSSGGGGPEIFASFLDIDHTGGGAVVPDPIAPTDEIFGFRGANEPAAPRPGSTPGDPPDEIFGSFRVDNRVGGRENKPTNDPTSGGGVGGEEEEDIFASLLQGKEKILHDWTTQPVPIPLEKRGRYDGPPGGGASSEPPPDEIFGSFRGNVVVGRASASTKAALSGRVDDAGGGSSSGGPPPDEEIFGSFLDTAGESSSAGPTPPDEEIFGSFLDTSGESTAGAPTAGPAPPPDEEIFGSFLDTAGESSAAGAPGPAPPPDEEIFGSFLDHTDVDHESLGALSWRRGDVRAAYDVVPAVTGEFEDEDGDIHFDAEEPEQVRGVVKKLQKNIAAALETTTAKDSQNSADAGGLHGGEFGDLSSESDETSELNGSAATEVEEALLVREDGRAEKVMVGEGGALGGHRAFGEETGGKGATKEEGRGGWSVFRTGVFPEE